MVAVPPVTPDTTPAEDTVATDVVLLVHVPPTGPPVSVMVVPAHSVLAPVMYDPVLTVILRVTYAEPTM